MARCRRVRLAALLLLALCTLSHQQSSDPPIEPSVAEPGPELEPEEDGAAQGEDLPEFVQPEAEEIALEAAYEELLVPEQIESNCARHAGRTLRCLSDNGGSLAACSHQALKHQLCVEKESPEDDVGRRGFTRVKKCRHGYMVFNPFDIYFGIAMELYGEWSELEWINMKQFIHPGDTVLDIGAHIGALTVPIAKHVGDEGTVLAFEPQRVLFQLTTANMAVNSLWNAEVRHAGVGAEPGKMTFETPHRAILRNFGGMPLLDSDAPPPPGDAGGGRRIETVPIITIDSLNLTRCDFLKIDVEGMEHKVIAGAKDTLQRLKPTVYYEDSGYGGIVPPSRVYKSATVRWFVGEGYTCYFDVSPYYNPNNYGKEKENFFQFGEHNPQVSTMILCVHPDRVSPLPETQFARILLEKPAS